MNSECIKALETRARWLKWSDELTVGRPDDYMPSDIKSAYKKCLQLNDLFFMNAKFCDLVDHARQSIPDEMRFDATWFQAKQGWLWIDEPFVVPMLEGKEEVDPLKISAVGWLPVNEITETESGIRRSYFDLRNPNVEGISFFCYLDLQRMIKPSVSCGYTCWSYFTIKHDELLVDVVNRFEETAFKDSPTYIRNRQMELLHEIRWIYTAFYLMAQRLSITYDENVDRAARRRAERDRSPAPPASLRVISLRRLEQAKAKAGGEHAPIDWQWQWEVRGHWRNQYYRSTQTHRPVFVEAYFKGPEDKPLKPPGQKLFMAAR